MSLNTLESVLEENRGGVWFLPADPRVEEAAWQAAPLRRGPFVRAVGDLVEALAPVPVGRRRSGGAARRLVGA